MEVRAVRNNFERKALKNHPSLVWIQFNWLRGFIGDFILIFVKISLICIFSTKLTKYVMFQQKFTTYNRCQVKEIVHMTLWAR
jgi:hypothetical protein